MSEGGDLGGGESRHDSSSVRVGRGIALVVVGVALGVILFHTVGRPQAGSVASVAATPVSSSTPPTTTPTTVPPPTTAAPRPPAQVKTLVANGTKTAGAGSKVSDTLRKAGYNVLAPTNTTTTAPSSAVLFAPGFASEAGAVAAAVGLAPATVMPVPAQSPVTNAQAADVIVVVGPDLAGQSAPAAAPSTSTTSTTAHTTTTAHSTSP